MLNLLNLAYVQLQGKRKRVLEYSDNCILKAFIP